MTRVLCIYNTLRSSRIGHFSLTISTISLFNSRLIYKTFIDLVYYGRYGLRKETKLQGFPKLRLRAIYWHEKDIINHVHS